MSLKAQAFQHFMNMAAEEMTLLAMSCCTCWWICICQSQPRIQCTSPKFVGVSADSVGRIEACSSLMLAAEARKAESASVEHNELPCRPPCLTGKDAWSHRLSSRSTVKMIDSPSLSKWSKRAKPGQLGQTTVRMV